MKKIHYLLILLALYSCEAVFEEDLSTDSVTILAPQNNVQLDSGKVVFSWQLLEDATNYQIQIAGPNFQNASQIFLDSILEANQVIHNLDRGTYEWRVRALNSTYETPYKTTVFIVN